MLAGSVHLTVAAWLAAVATPILGVLGGSTSSTGRLTVIESETFALADAASVTCRVKLEAVAAVGVPEMTPVAGERWSPAGSPPATSDQV